MMRSPPPPSSSHGQTGAGYSAAGGNPYQPAPAQGGSGTYGVQAGAQAFGGLMQDPTAQMGYAMGKHAISAGHDYMEQNVCSLRFLGQAEIWRWF